jgi:hypothetical protein
MPKLQSRISEIIEPEPASLLWNFVYTHVVAIISTVISISLLTLIILYLEILAEKTNVDLTSVASFNGVLVEWLMLSLMRRSERRFRYGVLVSFPSCVGFVVLVFWLAGGNVGAWALPLNLLMGTIYLTCIWFVSEPDNRGSLLRYSIDKVPLAVINVTLGFVPVYAIVIPARLLVEDYPVWYALWCGVGYPSLAFVIRKAALSFFIKLLRKQVNAGKMTPKKMMYIFSSTSFVTSICLLFGNTMLLYLSSTKTYALVGALSSIGTEVAGKLYTVKTTQMLMKDYLKIVVHHNARDIAVLVARAQTEAGVGPAVKMRQMTLAEQVAELRLEQAKLLQDRVEHLEIIDGKDRTIQLMKDEIERLGGTWDISDVSEEDMEAARSGDGGSDDDTEVDEKTTEEYWNEALAMFALRWSNEIIAEKNCIVVSGFISFFAGISPHSGSDQIQIFLIFVISEAIADLLLVYSLDKWFKVPFLRLPHDIKFKDKEFWVTMLMLAMNVVGPCLMFIHANGSAEDWFPDAENKTTTTPIDTTNTTA